MRISLLAALLLSLSGAGFGAPERPNVVLILADDFGYGSTGCYGADPALIRTPALDRLANEGRRFTDALTPSSVCMPTRYAVLTGRYCWRTELNNGKVLNTMDPLLIETSRPTLASLFKAHGYRTAIVGKWHLGYGTADKVDYTAPLVPGPLELGFDYQFAVPQNHNDITRVFVENHGVYGLRSKELNPTPKNLGLDAPQRDDPQTMRELTDRAVRWLEQQSSAEPFFLYFTPVAVHEMVTPSPETTGTSTAGPYGDFIHDLDLSVGRILDVLDKKGLASNTLVVFTSDNGGLVAESSKNEFQQAAMDAGLAICGQWRGGKHDVWEGGFRVPYLVRWPEHIPSATVCDETIGLVDFYATFADLLGSPVPDAVQADQDSRNVLPAWLDQSHPRPLREPLVLQSADGVYALREGQWKWIEGEPAGEGTAARKDQFAAMLFDLEADPREATDVSKTYPEVATRLSGELDRIRQRGAKHQ